MRLKLGACAVVAACWCIAPVAARTADGAAAITIVPDRCSLVATRVTFHAEQLATSQTVDVETVEIDTQIHILRIPAGRYLIKINSGDCSGQIFLSIFPGLTRSVVALVRQGTSQTEYDMYVVPYDAVAIKLPFSHMEVNASMIGGRELSTQIDGNYAFVDDIPRGKFVLRAFGANFVIKGTFTSYGANKVSVRSLEWPDDLSRLLKKDAQASSNLVGFSAIMKAGLPVKTESNPYSGYEIGADMDATNGFKVGPTLGGGNGNAVDIPTSPGDAVVHSHGHYYGSSDFDQHCSAPRSS